MGRAQLDRAFKVPRHAHAEAGEALVPGKLGKQGKIGQRIGIVRRDRHQPRDRDARVPRLPDQFGDGRNLAAAFL